MVSYEIYNYYSFINKNMVEMENLFGMLFEWVEEYNSNSEQILDKILTATTSSSGGGTHYFVPNGGIVQSFDKIMDKLQKDFSPISVTIKYGEIKKEIQTYKLKNNIQNDYIEEFFAQTDDMLSTYQEWIKNIGSKKHAITLGEQIMKYAKIFSTCKNAYDNFLHLYTSDEKVESEKTLEIQLLEVEFDLEEFNSVLESINNIYYELGNIMYPNIGGIQYERLKIVKIESGSIWSVLFGDENILFAVAKFLNKTIDFLFGKFTLEGNLTRQQGINNAIKDSLEMAKLLKEMGYDVDEANEEIQKAFLCSTKNLVNIASKSAKIKVNDEIHELNGKLKAKYLEENKKLLLTDGMNVNDDNKE